MECLPRCHNHKRFCMIRQGIAGLHNQHASKKLLQNWPNVGRGPLPKEQGFCGLVSVLTGGDVGHEVGGRRVEALGGVQQEEALVGNGEGHVAEGRHGEHHEAEEDERQPLLRAVAVVRQPDPHQPCRSAQQHVSRRLRSQVAVPCGISWLTDTRAGLCWAADALRQVCPVVCPRTAYQGLPAMRCSSVF